MRQSVTRVAVWSRLFRSYAGRHPLSPMHPKHPPSSALLLYVSGPNRNMLSFSSGCRIAHEMGPEGGLRLRATAVGTSERPQVCLKHQRCGDSDGPRRQPPAKRSGHPTPRSLAAHNPGGQRRAVRIAPSLQDVWFRASAGLVRSSGPCCPHGGRHSPGKKSTLVDRVGPSPFRPQGIPTVG